MFLFLKLIFHSRSIITSLGSRLVCQEHLNCRHSISLSGLDNNSPDSPHVIRSNLKGKVCLIQTFSIFITFPAWNQINRSSQHVCSGWFTQANVEENFTWYLQLELPLLILYAFSNVEGNWYLSEIHAIKLYKIKRRHLTFC